MNKRERVLAAIAGREVDRVPLAFWLHNFAQEYSAEALANETVRLYRAYDWDFLKPQSRPQCFAEMWGLKYERSTDYTKLPVLKDFPVTDLSAFGRLKPVDPNAGALAEQIEAFRMIRAELGPDVPIVATVFSPLQVASFLTPAATNVGSITDVVTMMNEHPDALEEGLAAISETMAGFAKLCVESGVVDGIYYAANVANRASMTPEQFERFQRPFDKPVFAAVDGAPFNILHMCGSSILFDKFADYPATVFSWATTPGNPSLREVHERTGRAVLGGLPAKPGIKSMAREALVEHAAASLAEMAGRFHLLGPDCSINPDTPDVLINAVGSLVHESCGHQH